MADQVVTPGAETTEYKITKWIGIIAFILAGSIEAVLATGVIPPNTVAGLVLGASVPILAALAAVGGYKYIGGRAQVKSAALLASAEVAKANTNPPQPPAQ